MTIKDIITKHYDKLHSYCRADKTISLGKTEEDIMHDVLITAMRKFKDNQIDEIEGLRYIKKTMYSEQLFQKPRQKLDIMVMLGDLKESESIDLYNIPDETEY